MLVAAGAVLAPVAWHVSDRLEAQNDFCISCHLTESKRLHQEIRDDFDRQPQTTLAGFHGTSPNVEGRELARMRCIDCHGGTSLLGRARVKALAAKDALVYLTGRFDEPKGMRFPLWEEDCRKCHKAFKPVEPGDGPPAFHALAVHNTKLGVGCVECHLAHEPGGVHDTWFVHAEPVRAQCARCHAEMAAP